MNPHKSQTHVHGPAPKQPTPDQRSEIISRMVVDVGLFHWKVNEVLLPVLLAAIGLFAKDMPNEQWSVLFAKEKSTSCLALASVVVLGLYLMWRTFSSVTLWTLNREARAYDPHFRNYIDDKTRLHYNIITVAAIEGTLMLCGLSMLGFFWLTAGWHAAAWWYLILFLVSGGFIYAMRFWLNGHLAVSSNLMSLWPRKTTRTRGQRPLASTEVDPALDKAGSRHQQDSSDPKFHSSTGL